MMATDEEKEPIVINYHDLQPLYNHDVLRYNDAGGDNSRSTQSLVDFDIILIMLALLVYNYVESTVSCDHMGLTS